MDEMNPKRPKTTDIAIETYQCTDAIQTPFEYLRSLGMEEKSAQHHASFFEENESGTLENYLVVHLSEVYQTLENLWFPKETVKHWREVLEMDEK